MRDRRSVGLVGTVLLSLFGGVAAAPASAEGHVLDGRMAPGMTFPVGTNGVTPGMTLSSLRGRVVWVKFILRECPRCVRQLPRTQRIHERWGRSGLVVVVIVHRYSPEEMAFFMREHGFSFPLATDPRGEMARAYGVRHRPVDYVIGIDGKVKSSNAAPDEVLATELGHYRLNRLGAVPAELEEVRQAVWKWDYGAALRTVEAAAAADGSTDETRAVAERVLTLAREDLDARLHQARRMEEQRRPAEAKTLYDRLVAYLEDTSLESEAIAAQRAFQERTAR